MASSMLFVYLCSIDNYFSVKVKDVNSVNTYSDGPSLGYKAKYSILLPKTSLVFRLSAVQVSVQDKYLLLILSDFWQSLSLGLAGRLGSGDPSVSSI